MVCGLRRRCWARYSAKKACTWGSSTGLDMICSFRVGIGFEAVDGGAEELWDRGEVPITLLGMDVAEVDWQVGEQCLHILPLLIPVLHPSHREGMTKRGQARGALPRSRRDSHALAQPCEPVMQGTMLYG